MSARWFRFYADAMRHPKVARLSDAQFRLWVELLSVAAENDGLIPSAGDLKHMLKRRLDHLLRGLDDLIRASLIEPSCGGYTPHNWNKKQYKSDVSTDRVRKHRKNGNVSETPPEAEAEAEAAKAASAREEKSEGDAVSLMIALHKSAGLVPPDPTNNWEKHTEAVALAASWLKAGADPAMLEQCVAARAKSSTVTPKSLKYYDGAVRDMLQVRSGQQAEGASLAEQILRRKAAA